MTVELSAVEARILGSLVEKARTTPDVYPMTTNAIVTACNQKTNRDPVVSYDARTVDAALLDMRQRGLVRMVHTQGARSTKHRQTLDEALDLGEAELVLVSVLLLRGAQTVGELRTRTERAHAFADLAEVEAVLSTLADRPVPLVRQLQRQPGQKEARWVHLLGDESERGTEVPAAAAGAERVADPVVTVQRDDRPQGRTDVLVQRVDALEAEVAELRAAMRRFAIALGETPDDAAPDGAAPDGAAPDGEIPDGETPDDAAPDDAASPNSF